MIAVGLRMNRDKRQKKKLDAKTKLVNSKNKPVTNVKKAQQQLPQKKFLPQKNKKKQGKNTKDNQHIREDGEVRGTGPLKKISYHVLAKRPAWADETGEKYGAYHRLLEEQKRQKRLQASHASEVDDKGGGRNKAMSAHKRWLRRKNKVGVKEDGAGGKGEKKVRIKRPPKESNGAAVVLWVGLALMVLGIILCVLGMGEDSFNLPEIQLIGPSLVGMGIFFCLLRIFSCTCGPRCLKVCPCCKICMPPKPPPRPSSAAPAKPVDGETMAVESQSSAGTQRNTDSPKPQSSSSATSVVRPQTQPIVVSSQATDLTTGVGNPDPHSRPITRIKRDTVTFVNEAGPPAMAPAKNGIEKRNSSFFLDDELDDFAEFEEVELASPVRIHKTNRRILTKQEEVVLDPSQLTS